MVRLIILPIFSIGLTDHDATNHVIFYQRDHPRVKEHLQVPLSSDSVRFTTQFAIVYLPGIANFPTFQEF